MSTSEIRSDVEHRWDSSIVPTLEEYIRIPNQSPLYDPQWKQNGYMNKAVDLARRGNGGVLRLRLKDLRCGYHKLQLPNSRWLVTQFMLSSRA